MAFKNGWDAAEQFKRERDEVLRKLDTARDQVREAFRERNEVQMERDEARAERDTAQDLRDLVYRELYDVRTERDDVREQLDEARVERDEMAERLRAIEAYADKRIRDLAADYGDAYLIGTRARAALDEGSE